LCSALFGLAASFFLLFNQNGPYKIYQLRQERNRLERETARLLEENTRLARTIDRLHSDPEMIQDLIRRELNYVKKNEIIIQLPEAVGPNPHAGALHQSHSQGLPGKRKPAPSAPARR
jgi:cell division protein FtsB